MKWLSASVLALFIAASASAGDLRLIDAVKNNDAKAVRALIAQHVDVNASEADGSTALNGTPAAVQALLSHGAKVNATEPGTNQTALMWAASEGNAGAVETLIEY